MNCNIISKLFGFKDLNMHNIKKVFYLIPKSPRTVQMGVTNKCNLDCEMCPRKLFDIPLINMDFETFKKIINKIPKSVKHIILTGWGEPLIHPSIYDMINYCFSNGYTTSIFTNGLMLDKKKCNKILRTGLTTILFSVDSLENNEKNGHKNNVALENLKYLAKLKKKNNSNLKIGITTTVHKTNMYEIPDIIKYAEKMNLSFVSLINLNTYSKKKLESTLKRPDFKEMMSFYKKIDNMDVEIRVDSIYSVNKGLKRLNCRFGKYCPNAFDKIYITVDGKITPCSELPTLYYGNIFKEDLIDVWNGKELRIFRKKQEKICGECRILKLRNYQ